jgi:predicted TIM-barrel fold metal-dependent hydrolase
VIVDTHTHTPQYRAEILEEEIQYNTVWRPDRAVKVPVNWEEYLKAMGPVDKAIVFGIAELDEEPEGRPAHPLREQGRWKGNVNDMTAEFVRAYPDRLIGYMSVHPRDPSCLDEIERCACDLGLKGLKLGPNYQNFEPCGDEAFLVYARAQELSLPIVFHTGTSPRRYAPLDYAHPRHFDRIAIAFPDLKMVLAHMSHPWQSTAIAVIRKHPNLYADISALFYRPWSFYTCMRLAQEWGVLHKLLFGTDYPVSTPDENMDALRTPNRAIEGTNLPRISEAAMEEIINRDALSLLGLG